MKLDFVEPVRSNKHNTIKPGFIVSGDVKDLMIKGGRFYSVWDESIQLWSTNEYDVRRMIDEVLWEENNRFDNSYIVCAAKDFGSGIWDEWNRYTRRIPDNFKPLDRKVIFADTKTTRKDYASKRLPYSMSESETPCYDKLMSTLYDPEERRKLEWAIGSIISGDSKKIQKFIVMYGPPGSGKGTVLDIIAQLFEGYCATFDAKGLGTSSNQFALEDFKDNPLVAIDPDADLSKIEDNTRLNIIVSHERMNVNEKFKNKYPMTFDTFIFMATNSLVKITDAKSGLVRRLIDVRPSERRVEDEEYQRIREHIEFELGGIAYKCLKVFKELGRNYYNNYIPTEMISGTNDFFNFVSEYYDIFSKNDGVTLKAAWGLYKEYVEYAKIPYPMTLLKFKEELKNYFREHYERKTLPDGSRIRNWYEQFRKEKIDGETKTEPTNSVESSWISLQTGVKSKLDELCKNDPAQYAVDRDGAKDVPKNKWSNVKTSLNDIRTSEVHYIKISNPQHIVIDFDIKDENGEKNLELNLKEASKFPPTYTEVSKGGKGLHLHYIYDGDVSKLSSLYDINVEVKTFGGNSALRRKLSMCNDMEITHINSGLPLKEEKSVISVRVIQNERHLRVLILKNLRKEIFPNTTPSVQFIKKLMDDAYNSGIEYDVSDMKSDIIMFATSASNQANACLEMVREMKFHSEKEVSHINSEEDKLVFFDIESFKNVFMICWKFENEAEIFRMINPSPSDVERLFKYKLVGFNNREYDNHMLYAASLGYSPYQLYCLSKSIIDNVKGSKFGAAYNLSHTDVYDFASKKQSLKKWEIELDISHLENKYDWDEPLPEDKWNEVCDYCCNDVEATEKVFHELDADWKARQILAEISGGSTNDTTNQLSLRFIFGTEKHPPLVYTDLKTGEHSIEGEGLEFKYPNAFPEYDYIPGPENKGRGRNMYRGVDLGFGGCVIAEPGMYLEPTITFDISGMHPATIIALNLFGEKTELFAQLVQIRLCIKHKDFDTPRKMLNGVLAKYLDNEKEAKRLSKALKIVVNSLYGLTFAAFDNPVRDKRNVNNIVALRGALFMKTLWDKVIELGYKPVHCKTDSIKIVNPDEFITKFILDFGRQYGYEFEVEHSFERFCLVNNAVYIGLLAEDDPDNPGEWTATGTQFQVPYVFKKLFSGEEIEFADLCETKSVKTTMYLDFNEGLDEGEHNYIFVGKVGQFCPIRDGCGGGMLMRKSNEGKYAAVTGTKGYRWMESVMVNDTSIVNYDYFEKLCDDAIETISEFGDFSALVSKKLQTV